MINMNRPGVDEFLRQHSPWAKAMADAKSAAPKEDFGRVLPEKDPQPTSPAPAEDPQWSKDFMIEQLSATNLRLLARIESLEKENAALDQEHEQLVELIEESADFDVWMNEKFFPNLPKVVQKRILDAGETTLDTAMEYLTRYLNMLDVVDEPTAEPDFGRDATPSPLFDVGPAFEIDLSDAPPLKNGETLKVDTAFKAEAELDAKAKKISGVDKVPGAVTIVEGYVCKHGHLHLKSVEHFDASGKKIS